MKKTIIIYFVMGMICYMAGILAHSNAIANDRYAGWTELSDTQSCGMWTANNNQMFLIVGDPLTLKMGVSVTSEALWETELTDFGKTMAEQIKKVPSVGFIRIEQGRMIIAPMLYPKDFKIDTIIPEILKAVRMVACGSGGSKGNDK